MALPDDIDVEEQYRDILDVVNELLPYFDPYPLDNGTAAGRTKGELLLLKQEVEAKRFPIPANKGKVATINYHAHNKYLPEELPDFTLQLQRIVSLVECEGIIKPRHYPRIIELIETHLDRLDKILSKDKDLTQSETSNLSDLKAEMMKLARQLYNENLELPLSKTEWPIYWNRKVRRRVFNQYDDFYTAERKLSAPLTSNWRPRQSQPTPGWVMPDWVKEPLDINS